MVMDYLERGTPTESIAPYEWILAPAPRLRGFVPTLVVAAAFAVPFSFVAGFIATGQPLHGLYALPLLLSFVAYRLSVSLR